MLDFGLGLFLNGGKKWATIRVFIVKKFLIMFLKDPLESFMFVENLKFGHLVGAKQVVVRFMSSKMHVLSLKQEADV